MKTAMTLTVLAAATLMVALGLGLQACSTAPMSQYQIDEQLASVREQQTGNQLGARVSTGVLMYPLSDQGAIVGVSLTGAKYYPDQNLN